MPFLTATSRWWISCWARMEASETVEGPCGVGDLWLHHRHPLGQRPGDHRAGQLGEARGGPIRPLEPESLGRVGVDRQQSLAGQPGVAPPIQGGGRCLGDPDHRPDARRRGCRQADRPGRAGRGRAQQQAPRLGQLILQSHDQKLEMTAVKTWSMLVGSEES
jgi:hypothetical protein